MSKKLLINMVVVAFIVGAMGSVVLNRYVIPSASNLPGLSWLSSLSYNSPIVITRREEVRLNEGVNLIELTKQAQTVTVSIYDSAQKFLGNGIIITSDGTIFTTKDVVGALTQVSVVSNDGTAYQGLVRATDPKSPLAVVSVTGSDMPVAQFADAGAMQTAQRILALGRTSQEFTRKFASGLITQTMNNHTDTAQTLSTENFVATISTDASLDAGFIGGPVVNLQGQIVGLVTAASGQVLPSEAIDGAVQTYLQFGKIQRPVIGLSYMNVPGNIARLRNLPAAGALVTAVEANGPAARAGLAANDLITAVNGQKIGTTIFEQYITTQGMNEMRLTVRRGTADVEVTLKPGVR